MTQEVMVANYPYNVGRNHLKLKVVKDGIELDLIGYNLGDYLTLLKKTASSTSPIAWNIIASETKQQSREN